MNVLGLDTSTAASAVGLIRSDGKVFESETPVERLFAPPGHARELMPAIDRVMREAGLDFGDLDAIAAGIGPGTFTGLRIGLATARGIAHARRIPLHAVSSLAALAEGISDEDGEQPVLPLIDARRGELFAAAYRGRHELEPPFVASPGEVIRRAPAGALAAGDGSIRFRDTLESAGFRVAPGNSRMHVVRGLHVCRLGATADPTPPDAVVPCYLRAPDAKPSRSAG